MKLEEAAIRLVEKFTSGNTVEVERNIILRKEWIPIRDFLIEKGIIPANEPVEA